MNLMVLVGGLSQIIASLLIGALFIFLVFKLFMKLTRNLDEISEIKKKNTAVGILMGSMILAVSIQLIQPIENSYDIITLTMRETNPVFLDYLKNIGILLLHVFIAGFLSFFGVFLAIQLFMWMTKDIDEMKQIKDNNVAVAIIIGLIIISVALLLKPGISTVLDALIPFPTRGVPSMLTMPEVSETVTNAVLSLPTLP